MAYPGRTLLACWLAVVLTGTVVGHRHAAAPSHAHGYGWAVLPGTPGPDALPLDHRHIVLLGIEFSPTGIPADGDRVAGSGSAAGVLALTEAEPHEAPLAAELPYLILPVDLAGVRVWLASGAPPTPATFCPLVTRARTGVLLS